MNARLFALALLLSACGMHRVDEKAVLALPTETKIELLEAENDLFAAIDASDEAATRLVEVREQYARSKVRLSEAKDALSRAKDGGDARQLELATLAVEESRSRKAYFAEALDLEHGQQDVEEARLTLARAKFERTRAQLVLKAKVKGAEGIDLAAFDAQVKQYEEALAKQESKAGERRKSADEAKAAWSATRKALAQKTGGGQGSPWVE